jgi:hypothetical protein
MSTSTTNTARLDRAELDASVEQSYEAAPRRKLVSALGVLVGTGVVTLAFGSTEANARSAVDDLDWVPQSHQALLEQRARRPQQSDFYNNQVSEVTTQFDSYQSIIKIHLNNGTLNEWLQKT